MGRIAIITHEEAVSISSQTQPKYLSIVSGKGGVGKSTVAVNLAVSLAERGMSVGLIDADIYGFSIPSLINMRAEARSDENRIFPIERFGVKWISSGFLRTDNQPVIMRGPMLGKIIRTFLEDVEWGTLDYLLFDLPPGTGDIPLDLHQFLGSMKELIVTTPHDTAAEVAFRAGAMTERTGHDLIGIVENMAYMQCPSCNGAIHAFGHEGGNRLQEALQCNILTRLPLERPGDQAPAPGVYDSSSEAGMLFRQLADHVIQVTH
ncbi:ATP-binding protein involved in chromosome partitioning [Paenibacillus phyllosphaerae]|uniref:Iron-sulfur cluster carrier protein n=1 Tax=Paenibacillus phyllosphaerae TaxID=274593 RepID=A0A7W5AYA5_9BACL|nr:Mrp/NBP35 family ATP-binding protein [Paenibacillus phyllosphaerae]MBB3110947.1 ATP-binding protein involved in chromosome partitioning [Paenibacillus phyllosphaerae]